METLMDGIEKSISSESNIQLPRGKGSNDSHWRLPWKLQS